MKKFHIVVFCALLIFMCFEAQAVPKRLSCTDKPLIEIRSMRALPDEVRILLDRQFGYKVKIADRGEELDDIDEKGLGPRRFSTAGINERCAIVVLQVGGHPYSFDIVVFERGEAGWRARRQGNISKPPATMESLVTESETALCSADEDTLFSCAPGHKQQISICSSKNLSASSGYIQYRAAKGGMIEFLFPEKKMLPSKVFAFKEVPWGQGEENSLRFHSGEYAYTAYSNGGRFSSEHGVLVQRGGKTVARLSCRGISDGGLDFTDNMNKIRGGGVAEPTEEYEIFDH